MALTGVSLVLAVGCKQDAGSAPAPQVPQVEVITVATQTIPDEPEFIGQAEASRPVEIRSQVTGLLKAVLFPEGRDVKKGDRLYQIDPVRFQAAAASAKAKIAEAEARLVQAKQDLARVKPLLAERTIRTLVDSWLVIALTNSRTQGSQRLYLLPVMKVSLS
jgi:membrane fusion protein (multidrug efflux system)